MLRLWLLMHYYARKWILMPLGIAMMVASLGYLVGLPPIVLVPLGMLAAGAAYKSGLFEDGPPP